MPLTRPVGPSRLLVKFGPFKDGLNEVLKPFSEQLNYQTATKLKNLDPGLQELTPRRGWWRPSYGSTTNQIDGGTYTNLVLLGQYQLGNDVLALVGKENAGVTKIYQSSEGEFAGDWGSVSSGTTGLYQKAVYYNGFYYLCADIGTTLSNKVTAPLFNTVTTAISTIPGGDDAFIWKDRLWVIDYDAMTVYWSKATDPATFAAPDGGFFKVTPDQYGLEIIGVVVVNDVMHIFTPTSHYTFTYNADPGLDGSLRLVTKDEGAIALLNVQDRVFGINRNGVFELLGNECVPISKNILAYNPLVEETPSLRMCILNNMLIVAAGGSAPVQLAPGVDCYAMNLDTGAWTTYEHGQTGQRATCGPFTKFLVMYDSLTNVRRVLWGHNRLKLSYAVDNQNGTDPISADKYDTTYYSPEYSLLSRAEDLGNDSSFKRIYRVELEGNSTLVDADADITHQLILEENDPTSVAATRTTASVQLKNTITTSLRRAVLFASFRARIFALGFTKPATSLGTSKPADWVFKFNSWLITVRDSDASQVRTDV